MIWLTSLIDPGRVPFFHTIHRPYDLIPRIEDIQRQRPYGLMNSIPALAFTFHHQKGGRHEP